MSMILTLFPRIELRARLEQIKGRILNFALRRPRLRRDPEGDPDRPHFGSNPFIFKRRPNPP